MRRTLLLPIVNTPDVKVTLEWTIQELYRTGDVLHLFHVVSHAQAVYSGVLLPPTAEEVDDKVRITEAALREHLSSIPELQKVDYELEVVKGPGDAEGIGEFICSRAGEFDAAAVIMVAHDKGPAVRFFVGSVTNYCIKHSPRPVMVVHPETQGDSTD